MQDRTGQYACNNVIQHDPKPAMNISIEPANWPRFDDIKQTEKRKTDAQIDKI